MAIVSFLLNTYYLYKVFAFFSEKGLSFFLLMELVDSTAIDFSVVFRARVAMSPFLLSPALSNPSGTWQFDFPFLTVCPLTA